MAITPTNDGVGQSAHTGGAITMTAALAALSPSAGNLLVAVSLLNAQNTSGSAQTPVCAISDNIADTGGGTWTAGPVCSRGSTIDTNYMEMLQIWTRVIGTSPGASKTATATFTANAGAITASADGYVWLNVFELAGQHATPVGFGTGSTGRQAAGPTTYPLTLGGSPAASSLIITAIHADDQTTIPTLPSGYSAGSSTLPADWGAAPVVSAYLNGGGSSSLSWTGLNTAPNHLAVALEIVAAAGGGGGFVRPTIVVMSQAVQRASRW